MVRGVHPTTECPMAIEVRLTKSLIVIEVLLKIDYRTAQEVHLKTDHPMEQEVYPKIDYHIIVGVHPKKDHHIEQTTGEELHPLLGDELEWLTKTAIYKLHRQGMSTELQADQNLYCEIVVTMGCSTRAVTTETIDR